MAGRQVDRRHDPGSAILQRAPEAGRLFRAALSDYYFNSMRLVAANSVWGLGLAPIVLVGVVSPLVSVALLPLLPLRTAPVFPAADRLEPVLGGERA